MKILAVTMLLLTSIASPQTFEGRVSSVQKFSDVTRPTPHMQLLLRTKSGEIAVDVGPVWYLEAQGIDISPDNEVKVVGSIVEIDGTSYVIATSLTVRGVTYQLSAKEGGSPTISKVKGRKATFC